MKKNLWKLLIIAGSILLAATLAKHIVETIGLARANTFGPLQATALIFGALAISAGLVLKPGSRENQFRALTIFMFASFLGAYLFYLPELFTQARWADDRNNRQIQTVGDDLEYQILSINLWQGYGFDDGINIPLPEYNLDLSTAWGKQTQQTYQQDPSKLRNHYTFYRAPGFPLMLAGCYALFGNATIVARNFQAILVFLTALILLVMGTLWAGWAGALAGGLTGLYYLVFKPGLFDFDYILTEAASTFWVALFCLVFFTYLKKLKTAWLVISAICLAAVILVRTNWLIIFPFLLGYLWHKRISIRKLVIFSLIVVIPIVAWSTYASVVMGKLVLVTTQGEKAFPEYNNRDVLEGIGPDRSGQGGWQPGREFDEQGNWVRDRNAVKPGQNGYVQGFAYWMQNFDDLPRLFYVKLRRGFFYDNSWSFNSLHLEGFYLISIGYLLLLMGLRDPVQKPCLMSSFSSSSIVALQLVFISILFLVWNQVAFWLVAVIWLLIFALAIFRPYGDVYRFPYLSPLWFMGFIACHFIITIFFAGYRFHWPLDVVLILFGLMGIMMTLYELFKRNILPALPFLWVIVTALMLHYFNL